MGITPLQYTLLRIVRERPGVDQTMIARFAALDRSTTTDILVRLESKGLVTRGAGAQDKRTRSVELTEAGQLLFDTAAPIVKVTRKALLSPLSEREQKQLLKSLETLIQFHEARTQDGLPSVWRRLSKSRRQ